MSEENESAKSDVTATPPGAMLGGKSFLFAFLILLGLLIRVYLACATKGTYDIGIWKTHATNLQMHGLMKTYLFSEYSQAYYNHPPAIGGIARLLLKLEQKTGFRFEKSFRILFGIFDLFGMYLILRVLKDNPFRRQWALFYFLCPISWIFSAYHGNTDSALGIIILASALLIAEKRYWTAGIWLGLGISIKWIILLAAPALFFALPDFKSRLQYAGAVLLMFLLGFGYAMYLDFWAVRNSVFWYRSNIGIFTDYPYWWGYAFLFDLKNRGLLIQYNDKIILLAVIFYSWTRRNSKSLPEMLVTLGNVLFIFYGLTNILSWQYFAWMAPILLFVNWRVSTPAYFLASAYVYSLYQHQTGDWNLKNAWNYVEIHEWKARVYFFRNSAIMYFLAVGGVLLISATVNELKLILEAWRSGRLKSRILAILKGDEL